MMVGNERNGILRLYHNGDGGNSGLKWYLRTRMARALGIRAGDVFHLERTSDGHLELVPAQLHLRTAPGQTVPLEGRGFRSGKTPQERGA